MTEPIFTTTLYLGADDKATVVGYLDDEGIIYRHRWGRGLPIGRVTRDRRVFRNTRYDERELGSFTAAGQIHSHGLFEGGAIGWVEPDGMVVQAGLIFSEEEIGRAVGADPIAGGAALLLLFLVDEQEQAHREGQR
jgi:hypothetical protein